MTLLSLYLLFFCAVSLGVQSKEVIFVHGNGVDATFWHEGEQALASSVEERLGSENVISDNNNEAGEVAIINNHGQRSVDNRTSTCDISRTGNNDHVNDVNNITGESNNPFRTMTTSAGVGGGGGEDQNKISNNILVSRNNKSIV